MSLIYLLRYGLLLALVTGSTGVPAQDSQAGAGDSDAREAIYSRLHSSGLYERRKALEELVTVAPDEPGTVEVLIRLFQSQDAEEARYSDFMQRVEQALLSIASKTTWPSGNVELLTSVLVLNDAYDARATNRTASTVAGVARYQAFSRQAIDDLTTVLWHRVDKSPNRTRNDNTRTYVVKALRHIYQRQGLPETVIDASRTSLGNEPNASVRRNTVLLIEDVARAQPALSDAMVQTLTEVLYRDDTAAVRALAAGSLRHISAQRDYPRSLVSTLQQAAASDPDAGVRHEALGGVIAAAAAHPLSPGMLPPGATDLLLQVVAGDPDPRQRLRALQVLGKVYATQAPDTATREVLLERLREESDRKLRGRIAVTLQEIHARQGFDPAVIGPMIPLVTDDPVEEVRHAIRRMLIDPPAGQDLATWMKATAAMGLSPAGAATTVAMPETPARPGMVEQTALRTRLLEQYVSALSEGRARAVRGEILQGLFALSLTESLPPPAVDVLTRSLDADPDAGVRLQAAAVLLHTGLQQGGVADPWYMALDDGDARVREYAAFALVELGAVDGEVLPVLLESVGAPAANRHLRLYSLRRLALWHGSGRDLPDAVQAVLLELTRDPDVAFRAAAWNVLRQFDLTAPDWRRAAADDDLGIQRMAWRELRALGVAKPVLAKWRDPKQRLELMALGLVATTLLALVAGAVLFLWRLLHWWLGERRQRGKMLAAQLLWLLATLLTLAMDAGMVFTVAVAHVGLSVTDLMQLNTLLGAVLALYAALAYLGWKLLPDRQPVPA